MSGPYPPRRSAASRKLLKEIPTEAQIATALRNLKDTSHFGLAITGTAYLQKMVERLIRSRCVKLSKEDDSRMFDAGQNGFLSSFSAQIRLCFSLGWIDHRTYEDLLLINDIRNTFAHSMHAVDFHDKRVMEDCEAIKLKLPPHPEPSEKFKTDPGFVQFHNAVLLYSVAIRGIALGMKVNTIDELQVAAQSLFAAGP